MIRGFLLTVLAGFATLSAAADAPVKLINITAEWCPNCLILNPKIDEAMQTLPGGKVDRINLDLTEARGAKRTAMHETARQTAAGHKAGYFWDAFPGQTGIAVLIAADTGEALFCLTRPISVEEIEWRLRQSIVLAEKGAPGARMPDGPDCPAPLN